MSCGLLRRRACLGGAVALATVPRARAQALTPPIEIFGDTFLKDVLDGFRDGYNAASGAPALRRTLGPRDDDDMVRQMLRSALVGDHVPDIIFLNGNLVRLLADRGLAVPLDPFLHADPSFAKGAVSPSVTAVGQLAGRTFGMGIGLSMPVVLFNADLVQRVGGDVDTLPADWDGIFALAAKIDRLGDGTVGGLVEYDDSGGLRFLSLLESLGGQMMADDEKRLTLQTPPGLAAMDIYRRFGEVGQARAEMSRDQARQAFGAGVVGVFLTMSSTIALQERAAEGRFTVLSMPHPIVPGAKLPAAGFIGVMLARDPARQRAAFEVLRYAVDVGGQSVVAERSGYAPVNRAAIDASPRIRTALAQRRNAHCYLERLDVATRWYAPPGENSIRITQSLTDATQPVLSLQQTPAQALADLTRTITPLLPT